MRSAARAADAATASASPSGDPSIDPPLAELPLAELENQICANAASIAAQTCRWLELLAEFERRDGWSGWGIRSCAHWLSYRCSMSPGPAREHMRVARSLADLPAVRDAFAAGRLSYSKVRAITRIATVQNEAELVELALIATAAQLERIVRGYRKATGEALRGRARRRHRWHWDEDGTFVLQARLTPEEGATYLAALRAAQSQATRPPGDGPQHGQAPEGAAEIDALVMVATGFLAGQDTADASGEDRTTVVVHVDADVLEPPQTRDTGASAAIVGAPDHGPRCRIEGGPGLEPATAQRLACDATVVTMARDRTGRVLDVGRKTRRINSGLRRALRARDHGCRFPGCTRTRFLDAHHIVPWSRGGPTNLDNLLLLCWQHHTLVHEGLVTVRVEADGRLAWLRPDGRPVPAVYLPDARVEVAAATFDPDALRPRWAGEDFDVGYVVATLLQPPPRLSSTKPQPGRDSLPAAA